MKNHAKMYNNIFYRLSFLFLITALTLSSFSGCSSEIESSSQMELTLSEEELKAAVERVRLVVVGQVPFVEGYGDVFPFDVEVKESDAPYDEETFLYCDKFTYGGKEYEVLPIKTEDSKLEIGVRKFYYGPFNDYMYEALLQNEECQIYVRFVGENEIPYTLDFKESSLFPSTYTEALATRIDISEAQEKAAEFAEEAFLRSGIEIDLSEYTYNRSFNEERYTFRWVKYINNVIVHQVVVSTAFNGAIKSFSATPFPQNERIEKLPNYTIKDYYEIAKRFFEDTYAGTTYTVEEFDISYRGDPIEYRMPYIAPITLKYTRVLHEWAIEFDVHAVIRDESTSFFVEHDFQISILLE